MFRLPSLDDLRRLASLAVPITLVQVSLMALGVEDCMIVGRYSAVGLAGVAIGAIYFFTIISFGFGMIFGIEPLDSSKPRAREFSGQHEVHVDRGVAHAVHAREAHLGEKRDPRLRGSDVMRAAARDERDEALEQPPGSRTLAGEKRLDRVVPARMAEIAAHELDAAAWTLPERSSHGSIRRRGVERSTGRA